jgi:hypothetical protein
VIRRREHRGQALVEFALAVPIFLMLIFGLIDLGRAVFINNSLAGAARDGARWGSVQARSATPAGQSDIADYTLTRLNGVPDPEVNVDCLKIKWTGIPWCTTEDVLIVEVRTSVAMITPIIAQVVGPLDLSAESRVVVNR